jgi:predicted phage terminase large subunit-like protein
MLDVDPGVRAEVMELLAIAEGAPPERQAEIRAVVERKLLFGSYSALAGATSKGRWKPYDHLVLLNQKLNDLAHRRIQRLLVTMPPRHGKSWTCSKHFPAGYLANFPDHRVVLASYEARFAARWGGQVRDLVKRNSDLLGISVSESSKAKNEWDLVDHEGGMQTAGIGGPITGKGANLLIIDDPVKNHEEAESEEYQQRNWDWYLSVAHSRLEPDADGLEGVVLLILTRWHDADLGGKVLAEHGDQWEVLNLPAMAEDDDELGRERGAPLCPERFDLEALEKIRTTSGPRVWSALYQQRPTPEGGGRFQKDRFRYWDTVMGDGPYYRCTGPLGDELIAKKDCWRFTTVDTAATTKKRSDFTVISVWDVAPPKVNEQGQERPALLFLVHRERRRIESVDHLAFLTEVNAAWNPLWHGVESATYGLQLIQTAIRKGLRIRELEADRDKWARSEIASILLNNGRVFFPKGAPWLDEWEDELLSFPYGTHDDQVDTFSYAADEVDKRPGKKQRAKTEKSFRDRVRKKTRSRVHPQLGRI